MRYMLEHELARTHYRIFWLTSHPLTIVAFNAPLALVVALLPDASAQAFGFLGLGAMSFAYGAVYKQLYPRNSLVDKGYLSDQAETRRLKQKFAVGRRAAKTWLWLSALYALAGSVLYFF